MALFVGRRPTFSQAFCTACPRQQGVWQSRVQQDHPGHDSAQACDHGDMWPQLLPADAAITSDGQCSLQKC